MSTEEHFTASDGTALFMRRWPVTLARAQVVLVHGFGEHCGRYEHVGRHFNGLGVAVCSYDQRGHGHSPGRRGEIGNFGALVDDLRVFHKRVAASAPDVPLFLLGHSMGGLVLTHYVLNHPIQASGLILSGALLCLNENVSPLLLKLSGILRILTPWLPVARVDPVGLARDPEVVDAYRADPFVYHGSIGARTGAALTHAILEAGPRLGQISLPLYVLHGVDDPIVTPRGSQQVYDGAASIDKTLRLYEGGLHESFHDLDRETVLTELGNWVLRHC